MLPKIKIKNINTSQLRSLNEYLGLSKTEDKKGKTDLECAIICIIFTLHLKLSQKLMFVQNPHKSTTLSFTHAEAYSILGFHKVVKKGTGISNYDWVVIKNITSKLHQQLMNFGMGWALILPFFFSFA